MSIVSVWLNVALSRKHLVPAIKISCNWWTRTVCPYFHLKNKIEPSSNAHCFVPKMS